jgi:hypothetical protein
MRRAILSTMLATTAALSAGASRAEESAAGGAPFVVAVLATTPATDAPVAYTTRKSPRFIRLTATTGGIASGLGVVIGMNTGVGPVATGLITGAFSGAGAVFDISRGNQLVAGNGVEDPAGVMGASLSRSLAAALDARPADAPIAVDDDKPAEIAALAAPARYVVDVKTTGWGYMQKPLTWSGYNVGYDARFRLIDTATKTVVAEDKCRWESDDSPSGSELVDNRAEGLKTRLEAATVACTEQFVAVLRAQPGFGRRIQSPTLSLRTQASLRPSQRTPERFAGYRLR